MEIIELLNFVVNTCISVIELPIFEEVILPLMITACVFKWIYSFIGIWNEKNE